MQKPPAADSAALYSVPRSLVPGAPLASPTKFTNLPIIIDADENEPPYFEQTGLGLFLNDTMHADCLPIAQSDLLFSRTFVPTKRDYDRANKLPRQQKQSSEAFASVFALRKLLNQNISSRDVVQDISPTGYTPSPDLAQSPPAVKVVRDMQSRIRSVHMRDLCKTLVFQFDVAGDLVSLEVQGSDAVREITNFAPSGMAMSKELTSAGLNQVITYDRFGRKRTQRIATARLQENTLFNENGSVASQVRQTPDGYELYTVRSDGSSLHQRDDHLHYSRHELRPDGSSFNVYIQKRLRVSSRCWYSPVSGTHELVETANEIVETKRNRDGQVVSRTNKPKNLSKAICCTTNEVITIG